MKKIRSVLYVYFLLIIFSCDEAEIIYPKIETLEIIPSSASNFLVKGNIIATGNATVLEYGFVISITPNPDIYQGTKIVVGNGPDTGIFEQNLSVEVSGGSGGYSLFVRAFLTNQKGTVYGEVKEFTAPTLTINSVVPLMGKTGDEITITGVNFSTNTGENRVRFNETEAEIVATTSTALVVKIPPGALHPAYADATTIFVSTGGQTVTATENFRILSTVLDFTPKSGTFGTNITIRGTDFYPFSTAVLIGGKQAVITAITQTGVSFNVPDEVSSDKLKIQLISVTDSIDVAGQFSITAPRITSVTPLVGVGGNLITITGSNFNTGTSYFTNNIVKFGTTEAVAFSNSQSEIVAFVPKGLAVGLHQVSVFTGVHTVKFAALFTLTKPMISSFSPASGIAGIYVTIKGLHFGPYDDSNSVLFGTTSVDLYNWSETSIVAFIPVGTPSGTVKITVNTAGQSVTSIDSFTIL